MALSQLRLSVLLLPYFLLCASAFTTRSWQAASQLAAQKTAEMTIDEKVGVLTGVTMAGSRCNGDTHPVARLGIPALCLMDGPAGVRPGTGVTGWPSGINAASTFSRRLIRERGAAIGDELRGKGIHVWFGPAQDLMRNPKGGRGWESFGPDPYLNGEGGYETIVGIQSKGVQACAKHFTANNQEHNRYNGSSTVDDRSLWEMYGYPFLRSIEADVSAIMCSFNRINGTFTCSSPKLLSDTGFLRSNGFKGYVITDWGADHGFAAENANAGLEMEQPGEYDPQLEGGGLFANGGLKDSVLNGTVSAARLDEMVKRVLTPFYRLGQDSGFPETNFHTQQTGGPYNQNVVVRTPQHVALAKEIASASAVLLKNVRPIVRPGQGAGNGGENAREYGLPVTKSKIANMAVIGEDAKLMDRSLCNSLNECTLGTMSVGWGSGANSLEFLVAPADAISAYVGISATIASSLSNDAAAGAAAAADKDVAFVFVNAMSGEWIVDIVHDQGGDRNDLELYYNGKELIESVAAVCNNTIVIVHSVGPVLMPWSTNPNITAIVYAGAPGEQTGPSIVDVLYGHYNPRGRLPFSIADSEAAYGTEIVYDKTIGPLTIDYTEGLFLDYRYMEQNNITPRFEFGFGLSYTAFSYSNLQISNQGPFKVVKFKVRNAGSVDGTEIPQLYLGFPNGSGEPKKVLRGFSDVALTVGSSKTVEVKLSVRDRSIWDVVTQKWVVPSGQFKVYIGASIKDIRLTGTF
ncbi:glycosyl hydrolase 3 family protein [Pleurotus pulmonarius]|nr:hypothetical protein EYR36_002911 [Pleurotus pulmonarius]